MTHLLMYRLQTHIPRGVYVGLYIGDGAMFTPIAGCGARYQVQSQLLRESSWRRITCRKCRRFARADLNFRRWLKTQKGRAWINRP